MNAHINLRDWFDAQPEVEERLAEVRHLKGSMLDDEDMEHVCEPLRRLMFPSTSAMIRRVPLSNFLSHAHVAHLADLLCCVIRYTQKNGKIVGKKALKAEWLQPLMRDMYFGGTSRQ